MWAASVKLCSVCSSFAVFCQFHFVLLLAGGRSVGRSNPRLPLLLLLFALHFNFTVFRVYIFVFYRKRERERETEVIFVSRPLHFTFACLRPDFARLKMFYFALILLNSSNSIWIAELLLLLLLECIFSSFFVVHHQACERRQGGGNGLFITLFTSAASVHSFA